MELVTSFMIRNKEHANDFYDYLLLRIDIIVIKFAQAVIDSSEDLAETKAIFFRFLKESE